MNDFWYELPPASPFNLGCRKLQRLLLFKGNCTLYTLGAEN